MYNRLSSIWKQNVHINLIVINIVTVNMTVYINSRTPDGREKLKSSKFWSRVKKYDSLTFMLVLPLYVVFLSNHLQFLQESERRA